MHECAKEEKGRKKGRKIEHTKRIKIYLYEERWLTGKFKLWLTQQYQTHFEFQDCTFFIFDRLLRML